ncbi:MAG: hypothetical protein WDW36_004676 [Sanguina aurantia]
MEGAGTSLRACRAWVDSVLRIGIGGAAAAAAGTWEGSGSQPSAGHPLADKLSSPQPVNGAAKAAAAAAAQGRDTPQQMCNPGATSSSQALSQPRLPRLHLRTRCLHPPSRTVSRVEPVIPSDVQQHNNCGLPPVKPYAPGRQSHIVLEDEPPPIQPVPAGGATGVHASRAAHIGTAAAAGCGTSHTCSRLERGVDCPTTTSVSSGSSISSRCGAS